MAQANELCWEMDQFFRIHDTNCSDISTVIMQAQYFKKNNNYERLVVHILNVISKALLLSQQNGINQYDVVVLLDNVSTTNVDIGFFKDLIKLLTQVFPENLRQCYMVNFPSIMRSVFVAISPFIEKKTRDKIVFSDDLPASVKSPEL